jgi:hypothetical protein
LEQIKIKLCMQKKKGREKNKWTVIQASLGGQKARPK